ncbi:glycosyltransferase family 2 protein [Candidatus Woesearchaeota archaeon]|nr:glycosyltransferase family 2 protein [Candidatus Woesearchaeota archaeon]
MKNLEELVEGINMKKSITIFVPAYNEEEHLEKAVKRYDRVARSVVNDYEILIVDDGSKDKTPVIADRLARHYSKVRVIHNPKNMGLGYGFRKAVKLARKNYFIYLTGEGEAKDESIKSLFQHMGEADIVIAYLSDSRTRRLSRRIISRVYTEILNVLFGNRVKYYNGHSIYKTSLLKKVKMTTNSFANQSEVLIRLLKKKHSYIHAPYQVAKTKGTTLFKFKNMIGVGKTVMKLFWEINIKRDI